jgi:membrane-associated phospholipid phosphatase
VGLAAAFAALSGWVSTGRPVPGDVWMLERLNRAVGTAADMPMVAVGRTTDLVPLTGLVIVVLAALVRVGRLRDAMAFALVVGVVWVGNPLLKVAFGRPRPALRPSPEVVSEFSYPSGHAAHTAALVVGLLLVTRSRRWRVTLAFGGLLAMATVGLSRLVIGVHYPSDVAGAWLWVTAWVLALAGSGLIRTTRGDADVRCRGGTSPACVRDLRPHSRRR